MSVFELSTYDLIIKAINDCKVASISEETFRKYLYDAAATDGNLRHKLFLYFILRAAETDIKFYLTMYTPPEKLCADIFKIIKGDDEYEKMCNIVGSFISMDTKRVAHEEKEDRDMTFNDVYSLVRWEIGKFNSSQNKPWENEISQLKSNVNLSDKSFGNAGSTVLSEEEKDAFVELCQAADNKTLHNCDVSKWDVFKDDFKQDLLVLALLVQDEKAVKKFKSEVDEDVVDKLKEVLENHGIGDLASIL